MFDNSRLRQRIIIQFGTIRAFASIMGMSAAVLSNRIKNKSEWKYSEIITACDILCIAPDEISKYFFTIQ